MDNKNMYKMVKQFRPYWTFEGIRIHFKNGKVEEDEGFTVVEETPLGYVPKKFYGCERIVREKVHDLLYNMRTDGPRISWIELLNIEKVK